ncbi:MAG TPA: hypothetical protein VMV62_01630 [Candidatus Paceibacterota bacterium]|nr:hypothetical protein [Candidatus Paceibacterota bacterium]
MEKPAVPTGTGNTWIIKLGVSGPDALRKEFERSKYNVSDRAVKMMRQKDYTLSLQERFATIAVLSVGDLGFDEGAEYRYACVRAVELGLDLCPRRQDLCCVKSIGISHGARRFGSP